MVVELGLAARRHRAVLEIPGGSRDGRRGFHPSGSGVYRDGVARHATANASLVIEQ